MGKQVSIITVNLNNAVGLKKTIDSVRRQTYTDYEYLIIDGGSSDESRSIIEQYLHLLCYWVSEPDRGIYQAMNKGISQATGTYCLFLNSGDWLVDEYVLKQCFAQNHTADLLIGGCHVLEQSNRIHTYIPKQELTFRSFYGTTIPHQSTFIKRDLFGQLGPYDETYRIHGDYEFWIRAVILHPCSVAPLNCVVANYSLDGISNQAAYAGQSREEIQRIQQQALPKRVLADYEKWQAQSVELQLWEWVKLKRVLYAAIRFLFRSAVAFVALKRQLIPAKSVKQRV